MREGREGGREGRGGVGKGGKEGRGIARGQSNPLIFDYF